MSPLNLLQSTWKLSLTATVIIMIGLFGYYWVFYDFFKGTSPLGFSGEWGRRIQDGERAKVHQEILRFVIILGPLIFGLIYFILEYDLIGWPHHP